MGIKLFNSPEELWESHACDRAELKRLKSEQESWERGDGRLWGNENTLGEQNRLIKMRQLNQKLHGDE